MKSFATFGEVGDQSELIAGPNTDYAGQAKLVKELILKGDGAYERVRLVDLKAGTVKARKLKAKAQAKAPAKKAAASKDAD